MSLRKVRGIAVAIVLMLALASAGALASMGIHTSAATAPTALATADPAGIHSSGFAPDGTCPQPPPVGQRDALSDAMLTYFGLPTHDSPDYANIDKMLKRVCTPIPATYAPTASNGPMLEPALTTVHKPNDAGHHYTTWGNAGSSTLMVELDATATVNSVNNIGSPNGSGVWINAELGGDTSATSPSCGGNAYQVRSGVSMRRNSSTSFAYAASMQLVGDDANPFDAFYVSAGDVVTFWVRYNPLDGDTFAYMSATDTNTGTFATYHNTHTPVGCSGGWLATRWFGDPIANFATDVFTIRGLWENDSNHTSKFAVNPLFTLHEEWDMYNGLSLLVNPLSDITTTGTGLTGTFTLAWVAAS